MSDKSDLYTDDKGEMDTIGTQPVADVLPPPHLLVIPDEGVKVTLTLSRESVDFFKEEARKNRVPYQRMIRALLDEYARRHR
ncbi:MAG TPA: hypothetical protein VHO91_08060 [Rhodopila sp.]|nr:hypothetical protein [Rhodopila sp.]